MITLNQIPDYLKEPEQEEWTPTAGRRRGAIHTLIATVLLAALFGGLALLVPTLAAHWALNIAYGFLITWILFAVMYKAAGMVCPWCAIIVIACAVLVITVKHIALLTHLAGSTGSSSWSLLSLLDLLVRNFTAWVGVAAGAYCCQDGDSTIYDLADLAMTNPLTGRRV